MNFQEFRFNQHILNAVDQCGFTAPTPIQQQAIPSILQGRDLLGLAQTGTGKTAAFVLPLIERLMSSPGSGVRMLVVAPTRELAEQINAFTQRIVRGTGLRSVAVYGGISKTSQVSAIGKGADIIVACPGRLLDLLQDGALNLRQVGLFVLDEADHMFDQGFLPDVKRILRQLPEQRQTLVFSATMPEAIRTLTKAILRDPVTVQIECGQAAQSVSHHMYAIEQARKTALLLHILRQDHPAATLVFTRTKHKAKNLAQKLVQSGLKATSLQGNLSQNRRQQALDGFKSGTFNVLVATDIAARGIDVSGISYVINFDVPDTVEAYIHRTGRTGRASCMGDAFTFATSEDGRIIKEIEKTLRARMELCPCPELPAERNGANGQAVAGNTLKAVRASARRPVDQQPGRRKRTTPAANGLAKRSK